MEVVSDTQIFAVFLSFAVIFVIICIQVYIRLPPTPTKSDKEYQEYIDYINAKYERELEDKKREKEQEREQNERCQWLE